MKVGYITKYQKIKYKPNSSSGVLFDEYKLLAKFDSDSFSALKCSSSTEESDSDILKHG